MSLPTPYYSDELVTIFHGDALELLPDLSADVVLADPPYNVGKDYGPDHDDNLPVEEYAAWMGAWLAAAAIAAPEVVFFPGTRHALDASAALAGSGLRAHRLLGWHKKEFAGDLWSGGPAMSWEPIIWASRSEKPLFNRRFGTWGRDFLVVPSTHGNPYAALHPCPKPEMVMRWLVGLFVPPDGTVLDPFIGSGTTLAAAKGMSVRSIGIDQNERYCEMAAERCSQGVLGLSA